MGTVAGEEFGTVVLADREAFAAAVFADGSRGGAGGPA